MNGVGDVAFSISLFIQIVPFAWSLDVILMFSTFPPLGYLRSHTGAPSHLVPSY